VYQKDCRDNSAEAVNPLTPVMQDNQNVSFSEQSDIVIPLTKEIKTFRQLHTPFHNLALME
jgi:hypothetical protein